MNFKDEYKKAVDTIVPDEQFIEKLSEKMKQEQGEPKHIRRKANWKPLVAAACLCVVVLAGVTVSWINGKNKGKPESMSVSIGNTTEKPTEVPTTGEKDNNQNLFAGTQWYQEGDSAENILKDFVGRLLDSSQVETVYKNTENTFAEDMSISEAEVRALAEKIEVGSLLEENPADIGNNEYYMAEFKNGDIIKFILTDTGYFKFQDLEFIFRCKK